MQLIWDGAQFEQTTVGGSVFVREVQKFSGSSSETEHGSTRVCGLHPASGHDQLQASSRVGTLEPSWRAASLTPFSGTQLVSRRTLSLLGVL